MDVSLGKQHYTFAPWTPQMGRVFRQTYAFDTETTLIDEARDWDCPAYVLGAAFDGTAGYFVQRTHVGAFLRAHKGVGMVFHNAAFDLAVLNAVAPDAGLYDLVDRNRVWDTLLLHRLYVLGIEGHTAEGRGQATLSHCAATYLGLRLDKEATDPGGRDVRRSWGRWLNEPPGNIDPAYLDYLAQDAAATMALYRDLRSRVRELLGTSGETWGLVSDDWLADQVRRFGPLTHHIQLRASIVLRAIGANGLHLDTARAEHLARQLDRELERLRRLLRKDGYLAGGDGSGTSLQAALARLARRHPELHFPRTDNGRFSTAADALLDVAPHVPFVQRLLEYREAEKLRGSFLSKMAGRVLHPSFNTLVRSGRTSSFGALNAQNLPRSDAVRSCFVPSPGHVFIDADYSTIELATLAQACSGQFGLASAMADAINEGKDLHRLVAAHVLGKDEAAVTKEERGKAKAINFGRPGGMGVATLTAYARCNYSVELTREEAIELSDGWGRLFPEMEAFLKDTVDTPRQLAELLGLTPASHHGHTGDGRFLLHADNAGREEDPHPILGRMCLKAIREGSPRTAKGKPYGAADIDYFWSRLADRAALLPDRWRRDVLVRRPSKALQRAVMAVAGCAGVFTFTGRLRAKAAYCARHNTVFQGLAADGAKLAMWKLWRAGFRIVNFIHDQFLIEVPKGSDLKRQAERIRTLMVEGMREVVPDVRVGVSFAATDRWYKDAEAVWGKNGKELRLWQPKTAKARASA